MKRCKITVLKTTLDEELAAGLRPVIFKIEATEEESAIDYTPFTEYRTI